MDKKNLMPQAAQPVNRITTGQLPDVLAELSEEALSQRGEDASSSASVIPACGHSDGYSGGYATPNCCACSYGGDDAE
ncbi:DUF5837 family protein [Microcoleus sp. Pol7_A1]|uniref:Microcyclamide/patellamide family RiPP n=1 Tax=Microcoleus asticus IPMA8 TaxID=2563858 RepID=A0ABX2D5R0_9CYAN|nr:DUF5837 family cyanobactin class RiPP [Microcoleus asticus]NQE37972.1 hypothetical protein [Microcoleus asticus IPMA8]